MGMQGYADLYAGVCRGVQTGWVCKGMQQHEPTVCAGPPKGMQPTLWFEDKPPTKKLMNGRTKLVLPVIQAKPFFTKNSRKVQEWGVGDPRN